MVKNLPATWETWVGSLGWEDPLVESMATHSSIFAWSIPWAEEPGGLQSMGSQRVGCNRACAECGKLLTTQILAAAPEFPIQSFGGGA